MIEGLDASKFKAYLESRRYSLHDIQNCLSFLDTRIHGTAADILSIEDTRDTIEQIYSEHYSSKKGSHKQGSRYLRIIQDFVRNEVQV